MTTTAATSNSNYLPTLADLNNIIAAQAANYGLTPADITPSVDQMLQNGLGNIGGSQPITSYADLSALVNGVAANAYSATAGTGGTAQATDTSPSGAVAQASPSAGTAAVSNWFGDWFKTNSANAIAVVAGVIMFGLGGYGLMPKGN